MTDRERIYRAIANDPTMTAAQLQRALKIKHATSVHQHLESLIAKGRIKKVNVRWEVCGG